MGNRILLLVFICLITAVLGEVRMTDPAFGTNFRISLAPPAFYFFLLWFRQLTAIEVGLGVGIVLPVFRIVVEMTEKSKGFWAVLPNHLPSSLYYVVFTALFLLFGLRKYANQTWVLVLLGILCDFFSNLAELGVRSIIEAPNDYWSDRYILSLLTYATLRTILSVGVLDIFTLQQYRLLGDHQKRQIEKLMMINSSLYEEGFYLKKSMVQVEEITRESYHLYRKLRIMEKDGPPLSGLSTMALQIAEQIHELKKDTQRVLSGLMKLMNQEKLHGEMTFHEISQFVIQANEKYAQMLGKDIRFTFEGSSHLRTFRVYALLSILNNLVSNAVEAIDYRGQVEIILALDGGFIEWRVIDNGPGIRPKDASVIFEPGFTTKFDNRGNASTGIGLSHCHEMASSLGGEVYLDRNSEKTTFVVRIPYASLRQPQTTIED